MERQKEYLGYLDAVKKVSNGQYMPDLIERAKAWDKAWSQFESPEEARDWMDISTAAVLENMVLEGEKASKVYCPNKLFSTT